MEIWKQFQIKIDLNFVKLVKIKIFDQLVLRIQNLTEIMHWRQISWRLNNRISEHTANRDYWAEKSNRQLERLLQPYDKPLPYLIKQQKSQDQQMSIINQMMENQNQLIKEMESLRKSSRN